MKTFLFLGASCMASFLSIAQSSLTLDNGNISIHAIQDNTNPSSLSYGFVGGQGLMYDVANNFFLGDMIGTSISGKSRTGQRISAIQMYDSLSFYDDFDFKLYDFTAGTNRWACYNNKCTDEQIQETITDFSGNGILDNPINQVTGWCGPKASNYMLGRAPFVDHNNDGVYNSNHGDYPVWDASRPWIRPHMMSYSSKNNYEANNGAQHFEVHTMTGVFLNVNPAVDRAIFTRQEIIYRGADPYVDSVKVGISWDPAVHCYTNDHSGTLPAHDAIVVFNSQNSLTMESELDLSNYACHINQFVTLPDAMPVPYLKFLNRRMDYSATGNKYSRLVRNGNPALGRENWVYNTMNGRESNTGTPFSGGHSTILPWPLTLNNIPPRQFGRRVIYDEVSLGVTEVGRVYRNQPIVLEYVMGFVDDPGQTGLGNVALVPTYLDDVRDFYMNSLATEVAEPASQGLGLTFHIYPNPANSSFWLERKSDGEATVVLYDMMGNRVWVEQMASVSQRFSLEGLSNGVYLVSLTQKDGTISTQKLIKG